MCANSKLVKLIGVAALCCISSIVCATPNIQHWQSASGAKVLFVEDHDIPMLDVAVTLQAGSSFDPADKSGVAGMTHGLLDAGPETRRRRQGRRIENKIDCNAAGAHDDHGTRVALPIGRPASHRWKPRSRRRREWIAVTEPGCPG